MAGVGIDDIAIYFPKLYFDMKDFAEFRGADFGKLNKGLGLTAMAIPDAHEDTATMGANACARLIDRNQLDPRKIGRIYLGTESLLMVLSQLQPTSWICLNNVTMTPMARNASVIAMLST